tara:strand:+ start:1002 stop:1214 length:213 start_codon:yes stop_codon:yes gene_type:complete
MVQETEMRKKYRINYYEENKERLRIMSRKQYYLKRYGIDKGIPKKRYYNTTRGKGIGITINKIPITLTFD